MASYRYLKDIPPQEPAPPPPRYTQKQKLKNWWDYHWKQALAALLVLLLAGYFTLSACTATKPDLTVGILADFSLPDEFLQKLQAGLSALVPDFNQDKKQTLAIESYAVQVFADENETAQNPYAQMADTARLAAALKSGTPAIFIIQPQNAAAYRQQYGLPAGYSWPVWKNCPALTSLSLPYASAGGTADGQALLAEYLVVIQAFEASPLAHEKNGEELWQNAHTFYTLLTGS